VDKWLKLTVYQENAEGFIRCGKALDTDVIQKILKIIIGMAAGEL
jgi:hypothetical protein